MSRKVGERKIIEIGNFLLCLLHPGETIPGLMVLHVYLFFLYFLLKV